MNLSLSPADGILQESNFPKTRYHSRATRSYKKSLKDLGIKNRIRRAREGYGRSPSNSRIASERR
jgi:hypothetical protein